MIKSALSINENLEEQVPRNVEEFPLLSCYEDFSLYPGGYVPWHWHPDVEFIYILQGGIRLCTGGHTYTLHAGEGAFINSNVLHYKEPLPGLPAVSLNQVFDVQIISGSYKSIFNRKYVMPVLECKELEAFPFHPSLPNQRTILELLRSSYDAADRRQEGYEFTVRNGLSSAWFLLFQEAAPILHSKKIRIRQNEDRAKQMLLFIQTHYAEKLSLEQIAASASISTREALRCFSQNLNTSPFAYLLEYRILRASGELLNTNRSVTDIAYACGFNGTSYFSKTFRKIMKCTPSEYRASHRESAL